MSDHILARAARALSFCLVAGLTEGGVALFHATRWHDLILLPISIGSWCLAGWAVVGIAALLRREERFAIGLLLSAMAVLIWLQRLAWRPSAHHVSAFLWIVVTAALLLTPWLLARLPMRLLIASAPLLVVGYGVATGIRPAQPLAVFGEELWPLVIAIVFGLLLLILPRWQHARVALVGSAALALLAPLLVARAFAHTEVTTTEHSFAARAAASDAPNVVLIVLDTLRYDRLGVYGYRVRPTTPFLDSFARQSAVYRTAYATSSWTLPSIATMFSGEPPERHGVTILGRSFAASRPLLAEILARRGYYAIGITTNEMIDGERGFGRGFHRFVELSRLARLHGRLSVIWMDALNLVRSWEAAGEVPHLLRDWNTKPRAAAATDALIAELARAPRNVPRFVYLHFIDPHHPCDAPSVGATRAWTTSAADARFDAHWSLEYDREIRYLDGELARAMTAIDDALDPANTIVAIVADHGEQLGEDGNRGHALNLDEALVHVPLLVRSPERVHVDESAAFSLVNLRALMLAKAEHRAAPANGWPVLAHLIPPPDPNAVMRSVQSGPWKYVETRRPGLSWSALYQLPKERTDMRAAYPQIASGLAARLPAVDGAPNKLDAESAAKLRALGYIQ